MNPTIRPKNSLEASILSDPEFIEGADWGKPRSGHPEGKVIFHINEVLENVEKYGSPQNIDALRLIAIIHDSFKYKVNSTLPKHGENHHGWYARKFAEKYIGDEGVLTVIQTHDDAFNIFRRGQRKDDMEKAKHEAINFMHELRKKNCLKLYLEFYECDNKTGDKSQDNFEWFKEIAQPLINSNPQQTH